MKYFFKKEKTMKTTRKIFLALVLTLVVAAVMSVCAFAFDINTDLPSGVQKGETGWVDSGYADIDAENSGWTLIGVPSGFDKVSGGNFPKLTYFEKAYFYWNKTTNKGVWIPTQNNMSGNSGMNTVIDPTNPDVTTDGGKKLYTIACAFIDIAEQKKTAFTNAYVGGYIYQSGAYTTLAETRPLWARYHAKGYAAAGNWDSITCTADQYTLYSNKKTELSATLSGEDLEDALVEYVMTNITGVSTGRNCLVDGVQYNTGWIFKQLEDNGYVFESVEFRAGSNSAPYLGTVGYVISLLETKTVLFDSKITGINIGATWRGIFRAVAKLKTVAHVTFATDGTYTGTVAENVVDLSGFKTVTPYGSGANIADRMFYYASGIESVVYFTTLKSGETENAGWVDAGMFEGATSLKTFTMNAPLTKLSATAFGACTKLTTLDLKGGVASGVSIATNAFSKSATIEALVYDEASKTNLETALTAAGYTNITVTLSEAEGGDEPDEPVATMPAGVTNTSDLWLDTGYTDVDTEDGWYMIGINNQNYKVADGKYPALAYLENGRFYWNKTTGEGVWFVPKSVTNISANWGEETETSGTKNVLEDGVYFTMAWVFNKLRSEGYAFESVEFRLEEGCTCKLFSTAGMVAKFMDAKTILMDKNITALDIKTSNRALFMNNKALTTFDHVTFNEDGSHSAVNDNVVDLSGFKTAKPWASSATVNAFYHLLYKSTAIENVIWFDSILSTATVTSTDGNVTVSVNDELAGLIDNRVLASATSLKTLTLTSPLTKIDEYAFSSCSKFTTLDLKGGIAAGATVHSTAFNSVSKVEIIVYSAADEIKAKTLFTASKFTITNANPIPDELSNAIVADGYSIRLNDENAKTKGPALRAQFTLLNSKVNDAAGLGYTLSKYGIIVFSENTLNNFYNGDISSVLDAAKTGTDTRIIVKSAVNGPYVNGAALEINPDLDKVFAAAVTGIPEGNYTSPVYTYAFAEWTKDGETTYTHVTYTSDTTGKTAHSLYDLTIFSFRNGIANSQNTDADKLWPVLEKGAFSITDGEQNGFASGLSLNVAYSFTDEDNDPETANTFTYLDLPLRAWIFGNLSSTGAIQWNSAANRLEDTSSTNIVWSLLVDNDDLVAVYRRAPGIEDSAVATLPQIRDRGSTGGFAPFSSQYFTPGKSYPAVDSTTGNGLYKQATIYSPILTEANENKIKSLVVDYGVDVFAPSALENTTVSTLATIVYPEGMTASSNLLTYNYYLTNMIYASENKTSLTAETQASGFGNIIDLSGLASVSIHYAFSSTSLAENIILPENVAGTAGVQETFMNASKLKRVWAVGADVPAAGTIDLTAAKKLASFCKNAFTGVPASTIIMPASFQGVNYYSMNLQEADPCARVFGTDKAHTIILGANPTALTLVQTKYESGKNGGLIAYQDKLHTIATTDADYNNVDLIKVTCTVEEGTLTKTIAEWKTYFEEKAAEEAEPTILPFTAGLNVNGMETFLSDNQWGIFETGVENVTKESTYTNIKSKGFDYVRIPVNFYTVYYEAASYGYTTEQLMGYLDTGIEYALANDLYVMIDFHGWFYIGEEENDYDEFLYCWSQVAERYKDASEKVIFELLNEPWYTNGKAQAYLSDSRLNTMQAEAVEIIRNTGSNNATRLIVLCTADGNKAWKLSSLVLPDDDNIAVAIHEYSPYNFTHQGFSWAGLGGTTTTLEAQGGFSSATSWDFSQIKAFKEANPKVPIILNEFGVNLVKATEADIETYLTGITGFCTENNIPWAYWQYYGDYSSEGAMSLYRKSSSWGSFAWDETALGFLFASASAS